MDARASEPRPPAGGHGARIFADAGDDRDLREGFEADQRWDVAHRAFDLLRESRDLAIEAAEIADPEQRDRQWSAAEAVARNALGVFRAALDYAEDSEDEEAAHSVLDRAGKWVRGVFGCQVPQQGTTYQDTCPVVLGHNRIGFSIGGQTVRKCSLCGDHLSECPHVQGRAYLVPGGPEDLGWCRVCGHESCEHSAVQLYRVGVTAIITQVFFEEVSLVSKPAFPTARIQSIDLDVEDLKEGLGPDFEPGMPLSCNRCLMTCGGLRRHPRYLGSRAHAD